MATDPSFASTPNNGHALLGTAETNLNVPTTSVTVITGGSGGTLVSAIVLEATTTSLTPTTVAGLVYVFIYDGTTYYLYDVIPVNAVTASNSSAGFRARVTYTDLVIKSGEFLKMSQSISGNASLLKAHAFGADF